MPDADSPSPSFSGPHFKPLYLNVLNEPASTLSEHNDLDQAKELLVKYRVENSDSDIFDVEPSHSGVKKTNCLPSRKSKVQQHSSNQCSGTSGSEMYEKIVAKHGDRTFQKFQKTLARCPEQVLSKIMSLYGYVYQTYFLYRYCWKGQPLLINSRQQTTCEQQVTCKSC